MADYGNRLRAVSGGALLGFADELEAALRSGRISGPEYRSARDSIRKNYGAYEEANPYEAGGLSMAGSIAPYFVPVLGPVLTGSRGAAMAARAGMGAKGRIAAGALSSLAANAATGAAEGYGSNVAPEDVGLDVAAGAIGNAILGPVLGGGALAGQKAFKAARKAKAFKDKPAERELYDLLNRYAGV